MKIYIKVTILNKYKNTLKIITKYILLLLYLYLFIILLFLANLSNGITTKGKDTT